MVCAIIPAAGIGSRMQSSIPKQYLPLGDGTVLLHSLRALLQLPEVQIIMVALHPQDQWWSQTQAQLSSAELSRIRTCVGGDERWQSVQSALSALACVFDADTPVMVHDAVRPCVHRDDLERLLQAYKHSEDVIPGALLAMPVADTLKRADANCAVQTTVDRRDIWAACTPQMFPLAALQRALTAAAVNNAVITDESSAMELTGIHPQLVRCSRDNIKITWPGDLELASWILSNQKTTRSSTP